MSIPHHYEILYMTVDELAELKGVHPDTIRRLLNSKNRPFEFRNCIKVGAGKTGMWLIPRTVADTWTPRAPGRYYKPKTPKP